MARVQQKTFLKAQWLSDLIDQKLLYAVKTDQSFDVKIARKWAKDYKIQEAVAIDTRHFNGEFGVEKYLHYLHYFYGKIPSKNKTVCKLIVRQTWYPLGESSTTITHEIPLSNNAMVTNDCNDTNEGLTVYFTNPKIAMLFKLTFG